MVEKAPVTAARRLRLPRAARLRSRADFSRVYRDGARARGDLILVVAAHPPAAAGSDAGRDEAPAAAPPVGPRLGLSVGRRFERSAVGRNHVKRLLREAFRLERHALPPLDLVLIPQLRGPERWTLADARRDLLRTAARAARRLQPEEGQ